MSVAAILLAAGASTRMGFPKQLLTIGGETLLRRAARAVVATGCCPVVAVVGARAERMRSELTGLPVSAIVNADWASGMGSSIRAGLAECIRIEPAVPAVLIALCDQPRVTAADLVALLDVFGRAGKAVAAASYGGALAVPAVFSRALFPELLALDGASGAREVIRAHTHDLEAFPLPAALVDVDEIKDLQAAGIDPQSHPDADAARPAR